MAVLQNPMSTPSKQIRPMNEEKSQTVTISLNPAQVRIVNRLYKAGLHGNSCAQVVQRLFCDGCVSHSQP